MCKIDYPCKCRVCGQEMLFFVMRDKSLVDYVTLFNKYHTSSEIYRFLAKNNVSHIKCLVCDKEFIIDWSAKFPKQLVDKDELDKFRV